MDKNINFITYSLIELIIVLVIIIIILLFKLKKSRKLYKSYSNLTTTPAHNTERYLQQEINNLNKHLESTAASNCSELNLRRSLLQFELTLLKANSEIINWEELITDIQDILQQNSYTPAFETTATEDQASSNHYSEPMIPSALFKQQAQTIHNLRKFIENLLKQVDHEPTPEPDIEQHLNELQKTN